MKRVAATLIATVIGLVMLLQFKVHTTKPTTGSLAVISPTTTSASASPSTRPAPRSTRTSPPAVSRTRHTHKAAAPVSRTITGQTVQTRYGPVQVQIVETGTTLTNVTAIQLPNAEPRSQQIAAAAAPILRTEALAAGSAHIDVVSGATYTSDGYAQSLQSALDNA